MGREISDVRVVVEIMIRGLVLVKLKDWIEVLLYRWNQGRCSLDCRLENELAS